MQEYIKKLLGLGKYLSDWASHNNTILITSNDEMKDIVKIVKSLEDSGLLLKRVSETTQNESKEQREGYLSMVLGTLRASFSRKYNIIFRKYFSR